MRGLSLVVASRGHSSSRCAGLSLSRPLPLRSTGSRRAGSATVVHGPSCSPARGILPDQGSNPCPLHWQADSQPLRHQGSPRCFVLQLFFLCSVCSYIMYFFCLYITIMSFLTHNLLCFFHFSNFLFNFNQLRAKSWCTIYPALSDPLFHSREL